MVETIADVDRNMAKFLPWPYFQFSPIAVRTCIGRIAGAVVVVLLAAILECLPGVAGRRYYVFDFDPLV